MSDHSGNKLIVVIGSGPGIGVGVASYFASKNFSKVALLSRNAERLQQDAETVKSDSKHAGTSPIIKTYPVDVADASALQRTLKQVDDDLGPPEVVVYNASRLRQTKFGEVDAEDLVEDFKVASIGLYIAATWAMPHLSALASSSSSHPSFLITGGSLYKSPSPLYFALAMNKAAQVSLAASLAQEYGPHGVHIGTVAVGGHVTPESDIFSPVKIAGDFWKLYEQEKDQWELVVHIDG